MTFKFDILQTIAIATAVLFLGGFIKSKSKFLEKFCIPNPVIGGVIFSIIALIGYSTGSFLFEFNTTLQAIFMTVFFTSIGFSCDIKAFGRSGKKGIQLSIVVILLIVLQNILGISLAKVFNLDPLIGLCTASVALVGGHGTSAAFAPLFEDLSAVGATTVALASATFGLITAGLFGGPIARYLVNKHNLVATASVTKSAETEVASTIESNAEIVHETDKVLSAKKITAAAYQLIIAMGIGTIVSMFLQKIGMTFPAYMGGMLMGLFIRNLGEYSGKFNIHMPEIDTIGEISLSLFISMALMTLKLWQLAELAVPMIVMLTAQVILMFFFSVYVAFRILGKDYDAAVMISGVVGFGLGAMSNSVANMQTFTNKYMPSPIAFFVITAIGSLVIDVSNSLLITFFMNLFS